MNLQLRRTVLHRIESIRTGGGHGVFPRIELVRNAMPHRHNIDLLMIGFSFKKYEGLPFAIGQFGCVGPGEKTIFFKKDVVGHHDLPSDFQGILA